MADEYSAKPTIKSASRATENPSPKHEFEGHNSAIRSFVFLHDNKHIVSGSWDGTMRKWDCHTGLLVGEPWKWKDRNIWALALSPDGNTIACGWDDGSIQQWNTEGKMMKGFWMRHRGSVRSLSWSPNGGHIASGFSDGTILIRKAEDGTVEVGSIETGQGWVDSLAYSPSGDRIASGGDKTICIWDSNTGRLVGSMKKGPTSVKSIVWSSDSSKLYSASEADRFACVFDSVTGTELHRFEHHRSLWSVALSPKHNLLACVGDTGIAQLWDTESYQPLRKPFSHGDGIGLYCVSFSRDGRYLAYGRSDGIIILWMVEDISPPGLFALPAPATQEETLPIPAALSYLDVDSTNPFARPDDIEDGHDDPYNDNFFQSSHSSLHSSPSGPSPIRRLWRVVIVASPFRMPANESVGLQERLKRRFLIRRTRSPPSPLEAPANNESTEPKPDGKVRAREEHDKDVHLPDRLANIMPGAAKQDKGKQREDLADPETLPPDDASSTAEFDIDENLTFWKFLRTRGKNATTSPPQMTHSPSPKAIEVYANRVSQGYVALKRKRKAKSSTLTTSAPATAAQASGASQAGPSSNGHLAHEQISSLGNAVVTSQSIVRYGGQSLQVAGSLTNMDDLPDSDSIQGSWNKCLDKLCFPCGHYHDH